MHDGLYWLYIQCVCTLVKCVYILWGSAYTVCIHIVYTIRIARIHIVCTIMCTVCSDYTRWWLPLPRDVAEDEERRITWCARSSRSSDHQIIIKIIKIINKYCWGNIFKSLTKYWIIIEEILNYYWGDIELSLRKYQIIIEEMSYYYWGNIELLPRRYPNLKPQFQPGCYMRWSRARLWLFIEEILKYYWEKI